MINLLVRSNLQRQYRWVQYPSKYSLNTYVFKANISSRFGLVRRSYFGTLDHSTALINESHKTGSIQNRKSKSTLLSELLSISASCDKNRIQGLLNESAHMLQSLSSKELGKLAISLHNYKRCCNPKSEKGFSVTRFDMPLPFQWRKLWYKVTLPHLLAKRFSSEEVLAIANLSQGHKDELKPSRAWVNALLGAFESKFSSNEFSCSETSSLLKLIYDFGGRPSGSWKKNYIEHSKSVLSNCSPSDVNAIVDGLAKLNFSEISDSQWIQSLNQHCCSFFNSDSFSFRHLSQLLRPMCTLKLLPTESSNDWCKAFLETSKRKLQDPDKYPPLSEVCQIIIAFGTVLNINPNDVVPGIMNDYLRCIHFQLESRNNLLDSSLIGILPVLGNWKTSPDDYCSGFMKSFLRLTLENRYQLLNSVDKISLLDHAAYRSPDRLAIILKSLERQNMNPVNISSEWFEAYVKATLHAFLSATATPTKAHSSADNVKVISLLDLSSIIYSIAKLNIPSSYIPAEWLKAYLHAVQVKCESHQTNAQDLSNIIYSLAKFDDRMSLQSFISPSWMKAYLEAVKRKIESRSFSSQGLSNLLYSFSRLNVDHSLLFKTKCLDSYLRAVQTHILAKRINSQELSNILYSLGSLPVKTDMISKDFWGCIFAAILDRPNHDPLNAQCLSNIMYSLGKLNLNPDMFHENWMASYLRLIASGFESQSFKTQGISNIIYSLGVLNCDPDEYISNFIANFYAYSKTFLMRNQFNPQELSNIMNAFPKIKRNPIHTNQGLEWMKLYLQSTEYYMASGGFTIQGLSNVALSLGRLKIKPDIIASGWTQTCLSTAADFLEGSHRHEADAHGITDFIYSLAILKVHPDVTHPGWMSMFLASSERFLRYGEFRPELLRKMIFAVNELGVDHHRLNPQWMAAFLNACDAAMAEGEMDLRQLANILDALVKCQIRPDEFKADWMASYLNNLKLQLSVGDQYLHSYCLTILRSLAVLSSDSELADQPNYLRSFFSLVQLAFKTDSLNGHVILSLLSAIRQLGIDPSSILHQSWFQSCLAASATVLKSDQFSLVQLNHLLNELYELDVDIAAESNNNWTKEFLNASLRAIKPDSEHKFKALVTINSIIQILRLHNIDPDDVHPDWISRSISASLPNLSYSHPRISSINASNNKRGYHNAGWKEEVTSGEIPIVSRSDTFNFEASRHALRDIDATLTMNGLSEKVSDELTSWLAAYLTAASAKLVTESGSWEDKAFNFDAISSDLELLKINPNRFFRRWSNQFLTAFDAILKSSSHQKECVTSDSLGRVLPLLYSWGIPIESRDTMITYLNVCKDRLDDNSMSSAVLMNLATALSNTLSHRQIDKMCPSWTEALLRCLRLRFAYEVMSPLELVQIIKVISKWDISPDTYFNNWMTDFLIATQEKLDSSEFSSEELAVLIAALENHPEDLSVWIPSFLSATHAKLASRALKPQDLTAIMSSLEKIGINPESEFPGWRSTYFFYERRSRSLSSSLDSTRR